MARGAVAAGEIRPAAVGAAVIAMAMAMAIVMAMAVVTVVTVVPDLLSMDRTDSVACSTSRPSPSQALSCAPHSPSWVGPEE